MTSGFGIVELEVFFWAMLDEELTSALGLASGELFEVSTFVVKEDVFYSCLAFSLLT